MTKKIMKVGLDVSMNSTGVVINIDNKIAFHKILSELKGRHSSDHTLQSYDRVFSKTSYSVENINKIISAEKQANMIKDIIMKAYMDSSCDGICVRMEGSAMGSFGGKSRADDMTNFSAVTKRKLISIKQVESISIVPPTTLKKFATGKGNAKKDLILEEFYLIHPEYDQTGKNDDIADAYYLTMVDEVNSNITTWRRDDYENIYQFQITSKSVAVPKTPKPKKKTKAKAKK